MEKQKQNGQEISCALLGSNVCPKPKECDGVDRKCEFWKGHSGR